MHSVVEQCSEKYHRRSECDSIWVAQRRKRKDIVISELQYFPMRLQEAFLYIMLPFQKKNMNQKNISKMI